MQVRELLQTLDRRRSYFTITHFAELLRDEQIMIPCDLKVGPQREITKLPDNRRIVNQNKQEQVVPLMYKDPQSGLIILTIGGHE